MRLEHDYTLEYTAENGAESRCRVRIYAPDYEQDAPVVIFSETPDNTGQSVTNAAEVIAGALLQRHGLAAGTAPVFIEHYPPESEPIRHPESFDLVTFAGPLSHRRIWGASERWIALLGKPEWRPLQREQVERLLGCNVEPAGEE